MSEEPHVGNLIRQVIAAKGIRISWLAKQLNCHRNNIYKMYSRPWIDTQTLMKLSKILEYDFFSALSDSYKQDKDE